MDTTVKAKCRKCGNFASADDFKMSYTLRMMVCPNCFTGKSQKKEEAKQNHPPKPAGWDAEDEYLEKSYRLKQKEKPQFRKIPGSNNVECICNGCKYSFRYDPFKKTPRTCPFCNKEVPKINTFTIL